MTDWRDKELKKAAAKYGRPFKCGPRRFAREVLHKGAWVKAAPNQDAQEQAQEPVIVLATERSSRQ